MNKEVRESGPFFTSSFRDTRLRVDPESNSALRSGFRVRTIERRKAPTRWRAPE
jgi:hypothetical protein